ncbi:methionine ABC transporter ATP-binding protein [Candidiatus Paracoxiella cheracis]|uniref:methionine ABC transporter ATP-binding protein n=1 Tax=Candidiatus Paracoxiella cheracis TaxID=3405120 RepID=UPI003BF4BA0A
MHFFGISAFKRSLIVRCRFVRAIFEIVKMIELKNVTKSYHSKHATVEALSDINLKVNAGEIFGVIGKSGAGKSTLIRCVNLLERPTSGEVVVNGQELTALSQKQLRLARHHIGMVFQHFNLLNTRTVYQNVAFPLELLGVKKQEIERRVMPLLELTGLEQKAKVYPSRLSGGQKQRVAIARAVATDPKVLLCDEMTSALDPETTASILQLIKDINRKLNLSILLITHEMDVIKAIADYVAVLDHGKSIEQSDVATLFKQPKTAVAKRLTQSALKVNLPQSLQDKLLHDPIAEGYTLLRIDFLGETAAEPIINALIKKYDVNINILQASLELVHDETVGVMLVATDSSDEKIQAGAHFLREKGLDVQVLGYVSRNDWLYH